MLIIQYFRTYSKLNGKNEFKVLEETDMTALINTQFEHLFKVDVEKQNNQFAYIAWNTSLW